MSPTPPGNTAVGLNGSFRGFGRGSIFMKPVRPVATVSRPIPVALRQSIALPVQPRQARSQVLLRAVTTQPVAISKPRRHHPAGQKALLAMAIIVFVAGIAVAALGLKTNKEIKAQLTSAPAAQTDSSEKKPSDQAFALHMVDPSEPRYIHISKIGVKARVTAQGLDRNGALNAPGNVHDVGWYRMSRKPGESGAMLLDSHVSGKTTKGAFYRLKDLRADDQIEVERGDGQTFTYRVVSSVVSDADKTDMRAAMQSIEPGKPGLNLITCTGAFDKATETYAQRLTVFAVQL
ncbi:class F sortase [Candidatus Saccharibacteria bacterium]|nr:MAG: class F sortase [Candidatus Saccharibacteria bacterium]